MYILSCFFFLILRRPPNSTPVDTHFPSTTLFRSCASTTPNSTPTSPCCRASSKADRRSSPGLDRGRGTVRRTVEGLLPAAPPLHHVVAPSPAGRISAGLNRHPGLDRDP